ncbi:hypothetical protein [Roseomonas elaeocarpi]|uniref:DUF2232 domain-containing protein n=1 Tax=Roseomonas elaeocarpi TaxID=907779 RepID=A0ABV6JQ41_9PROT
MPAAGSTQGLTSDPRILAGASAGLACAVATLWAVHGLPLGWVLLLLVTLPLFLAGLSFGTVAAGIGTVVGAAALLPTTGLAGAGNFLVASGLPAVTMVAAGLRGVLPGGAAPLAAAGLALSAGLPLALLGLWSAATVLVALWVTGPELEQGMTEALGAAMRDTGAASLDPAVLRRVVQAGIAMGGAFLALPAAVCGMAAQGFLARRGFALRATPRWSHVRLPGWYLPLLAVAVLVAWVSPGLLTLAAAVALLGPVFLQGLAVVHRRLRGPVLIPFYLVLVLLFLPVVAVLIGLGLFEQFGRKPDQT